MGTARRWLNSRLGIDELLRPFRRRVVPDGPRWTYTTGPCLMWMLVVELVTGLALMTSYSPSTTSAWASVFYIESLPSGSFIRGLHYYAGQALIVLFIVHTIRVMAQATYRAPRELIWVTGLICIPLVTVWAVTGNPLQGSQKAYAQIEVEGNIIASTPVVGPVIRRVLIGGDSVGNLTITHLHFLHVAFLPILVGFILYIHVTQVIRHSPKVDDLENPDAAVRYWPAQTLRNLIASAGALAVVGYLAYRYGAPLETPADPELHHIPRPEWYFLFLFELRRYFTGDYEFIATIVIPGLTLLVLLLLPAIDWVCSQRLSAVLRTLIVIGGVCAWSGLTLSSVLRDREDSEYQESLAEMEQLADRAQVLALQGIPPAGASALLRNDPKIQGPLLFEQHCAVCHPFLDPEGEGIAAETPSAPNLYGFATRDWIAGLLDPEQVGGERYFGNTGFTEGEMVDWVVNYGYVADDEKEAFLQNMKLVAAALSAQAELRMQAEADVEDIEQVREGIRLIKEEVGCVDCHKFSDAGELGYAPDLTGYGSRSWLIAFISNPEHRRFYPESNEGMPIFQESLDRRTIGLIADWLRQEWFEADQFHGNSPLP